MKKPVVRKLRCAVYTRKSTEEGLDMEFNSLDAQREACEAYVASQKQDRRSSMRSPTRSAPTISACRRRRRRCGWRCRPAPARPLKGRPVHRNWVVEVSAEFTPRARYFVN